MKIRENGNVGTRQENSTVLQSNEKLYLHVSLYICARDRVKKVVPVHTFEMRECLIYLINEDLTSSAKVELHRAEMTFIKMKVIYVVTKSRL